MNDSEVDDRENTQSRRTQEVITWEGLTQHLEQRWDMPKRAVCEQLVHTIWYAMITPLDFLKGVSSRLEQETSQPAPVRRWASNCHRIIEKWVGELVDLMKDCSARTSSEEGVCQYIVQGYASCLERGIDVLLSDGKQIARSLEETQTRLAGVFGRYLHNVKQIYEGLLSQDLSWLLAYIDEEDRLSHRSIPEQ